MLAPRKEKRSPRLHRVHMHVIARRSRITYWIHALEHAQHGSASTSRFAGVRGGNAPRRNVRECPPNQVFRPRIPALSRTMPAQFTSKRRAISPPRSFFSPSLRTARADTMIRRPAAGYLWRGIERLGVATNAYRLARARSAGTPFVQNEWLVHGRASSGTIGGGALPDIGSSRVPPADSARDFGASGGTILLPEKEVRVCRVTMWVARPS